MTSVCEPPGCAQRLTASLLIALSPPNAGTAVRTGAQRLTASLLIARGQGGERGEGKGVLNA